MIVTAFDTETTDLYQFKMPAGHDSQPRLVQMALIMYDTTARRVLKKASFIVVSDKESGEKAFAAHGISKELSVSLGIQPITAISMFRHFAVRSDRMVAHNKDFDLKIFKAQFARLNHDFAFMDGKDVVCTMAASKAIVKAPPTPKMVAANMGGFKAPTLTECYMHFYGEHLEGAHDALIDTEACLRIYMTLKGRGVITE